MEDSSEAPKSTKKRKKAEAESEGDDKVSVLKSQSTKTIANKHTASEEDAEDQAQLIEQDT